MSELEPSPRLKWITKLLVRAYMKAFHRYEVLGQEHLPPQPPVFALTNHVSNLDVPAFGLADPYKGSYLVAKESLTKTPVVKQILRNLDSKEMKNLAELALQLESPKEIQQFVKGKVPFIAELV